MTESLVLDTVTEMATSLAKQLPLVIEEFQSRYGESPVLERLPLKINQQIRGTLYLV